MRTAAPYRREIVENKRIVISLPEDEATAIDSWGVPAGMPNRTIAVRELIKKGLEKVAAEAAANEKSDEA